MSDEKKLNEEITEAAEDKSTETAAKAEETAKAAAEKATDIAAQVEEKAESFVEEAKEKLEDVEEKAGEIIDAAEDKAEELAEKAGDAVEAAEKKVGEIIDAAEDKVGEIIDDAEDKAEDVIEAAEDQAEKVVENAKKNPAVPIVIGIIAVIVIALIVLGIIFGPSLFNKYNKRYVDVSGRTIEEVSDQMGMSLEQFLERFDLPKNMPANTSESAAYYSMPVSMIAEMRGVDFETLRDEILHFPDTITEDMTWYEAEGETALKYVVGEDNVDAYIEEYGLGSDVNGDTLFKEVRDIIDEADRQSRIESEQAAKTASDEAATADDTTADDTTADDSTAADDGAAANDSAESADGAAEADNAAEADTAAE